MTLIERLPTPAFKSTKLSKLLKMTPTDYRQAAVFDDTPKKGDERIVTDDVRAQFFGDPASTRRMTKAIATADAQSASVIGIVGARPGVGASLTSRQIAGAFASFGRKTLLVDASHVKFGDLTDQPVSATPPNLWDSAVEARPFLSYIDLSKMGGPISNVGNFHEAVDLATRDKQTVVVDLPPILLPSGLPDTTISAAGRACDLIFLVCLSGDMRRSELSECVETCKVIGLKLDGMILNDWQLPANGLLES